MRNMLIGLAFLLFLSGSAFAHLCNNIYRTPDRIIVKPERSDLLLETGDQVRIFVRNNYPTFLRNVRLVAEADGAGVTATVTPESLGELVPGEKQVFTVSIAAGQGAREGRYAVRLGISADNVNLHPVKEPTEDELIRVFEEGNPYPHPLACESLARMDSQRGLEHLNELIQGSAGREVQTQAMRTGGRSGNQRVAEMLVPFLTTRDGYVRGNAILGLGYLKSNLDEIQGILQVQDPFVCVCAATALILADQYDPKLPDELVNFTRHDDPSTRVVAAWGCALAGNEDVLDVIAEGLRSDDATLVVLAGDALLSLADQQEKKDAEGAEAGDQQASKKGNPETQVASTRFNAGNVDVSGGAQALEGLEPDRLFVNAVTPLPTAQDGGTLTVNVYHSYPAPLHNVRLSVAGTEYASETVEAMRPTELRAIEIPVQKLDATGKGTTEMQVVLSCDELKEPATFPVIVPVTEADRSLAEASLAMPVGELQVRVQRFGDWYAFAWGAPLVLVAIGAVFLARRRR